MSECHICGLRNNILFETPNWVVIVNIDQNYLGRLLVQTKRHVENLSALSNDEWNELRGVIQKSEKAMKKAFPEIAVFNWICAMNHAFREKPYHPHVHWHVLPRIEKPVTFNGFTWTDKEFGKHYDPKSKNVVSEAMQKALVTHIQNYL